MFIVKQGIHYYGYGRDGVIYYWQPSIGWHFVDACIVPWVGY